MKLVEVSQLSFRRKRGSRLILDEIAFDLSKGQALCVLGPNGAGKSTLIGCLLGLIGGFSGRILLAGRPITELSRREVAWLAAYVPQSSHANFAYTALQMVLMGRSPHVGSLGAPSSADRRCAQQALDRTGAAQLSERLFTELSGGEQQLVLIARALAQDAPLIVMDEPTAGLDLGNQGRVLRLIRDLSNAGKSVIMTTHQPDHAFVLGCEVALMKAGKILACGSVASLCDETSMSDLYSARLRKLSESNPDTLAAFVPDIDHQN